MSFSNSPEKLVGSNPGDGSMVIFGHPQVQAFNGHQLHKSSSVSATVWNTALEGGRSCEAQ